MSSYVYVGQVCNLRRVFNPPCTGPEKVLRRSTEAGIDGIHLNVCRNPLKFFFIAHPSVVAFILPEGLPDDAQHPISFASGKSFERVRDLRHRHARCKKHMDVICHDNESVKNEARFPFQMSNGIDHHFGELWPSQMEGPIARRVEETVHGQKCLTAGGDTGKGATRWKAASQAPRQKYRMADRIVVRKSALVKSGHEGTVRTNSDFSHGSAGRLKIGRRLKTCPTSRACPIPVMPQGGSHA